MITIQIFEESIYSGKNGDTIRKEFELNKFQFRQLLLDIKYKLPSKAEAEKQKLYYALDTCKNHGVENVFTRSPATKYWRCFQCVKDYEAHRYSSRHSKMLIQQKIRREERKINILNGRKCSACGYDKTLRALHFHHLNPLEKAHHMSDIFASYSLEKCLSEADKCEVLCATCHAELESDKHQRSQINKARVFKGRTIICTLHGEAPAQSKGNNRFRCTICANEANKKRRHKKKQKLAEFLGSECKLCTYSRINVIQFHHLIPQEKEFHIATQISKNLSYEKLIVEAKKCILLCPNCHVEVEHGMHDVWHNAIISQYRQLGDSKKIVFP